MQPIPTFKSNNRSKFKKLKLGPRNPSKINNKCPVTMSTASKYVRE